MKRMIVLSLIVIVFISGCQKINIKREKMEDRQKVENNIEKNEKEKEYRKIKVLVPDYAVPPEKLLNEFEKTYGIKPEFDKLNWTKMYDAVKNQDIEADVLQIDWTWIGEYKKDNLIAPISVSEENEIDMPSIKSFKLENKFYAKPYFNDFKLGFYNKKQFHDAGIDTPPKTWNEVYEYSKKLKEEKIVNYPYHIVLNNTEDSGVDFITLAYAMYGKVFDEDGNYDFNILNQTLSYVKIIYNEGLISPDNDEIYVSDDYRKIATGETSFMTGMSSYLIGLNDESKTPISGEVIETRIPGLIDLTDYILACPEGLGIMNSSKNKEDAQKYIDWFTSSEVQEELFNRSNIIPSRLNVLKKVVDKKKIKASQELLESAKIASSPVTDMAKNNLQEVLKITSYGLYQMTKKNLSVEETTQYIYNSIRDLLNTGEIPNEIINPIN